MYDVYVCVCVCVCVYVYVYVYMCMCMCIGLCTGIYVYVCICVYVYLYMCICTYVYVHVHMDICIYDGVYRPFQSNVNDGIICGLYAKGVYLGSFPKSVTPIGTKLNYNFDPYYRDSRKGALNLCKHPYWEHGSIALETIEDLAGNGKGC